MTELDIVIPVYNEGANILRVLEAFRQSVQTPFRVLICYDRDDDDTLVALKGYSPGFPIVPVRNAGRGALGAVVTGLRESTAPAVLTYPADDDYNAVHVDAMVAELRKGSDIVVASRFIPGGYMRGCPWLKATLVRCSAFALYHLGRLPTRDPSNGLRLFSRRVVQRIPIESTVGFAYSIELLAKAHRLGWTITEVAAGWEERKAGRSRFAVVRWLPQYWKWFSYSFATTYLRRGPETVAILPE